MGHGDFPVLARLIYDRRAELRAEFHQLAVLAVDPDFNEVSTFADDLVDLRARFVRRLVFGAGFERLGHETVLNGEDPRAAQIAAFLLGLDGGDVVGIETHVSRGGNPIQGILAQLGVSVRVDVAMSIDDAWHDKLTSEIHNGCAGWRCDLGRWPHVSDDAVFYHN